jgi:small GTP-binding protein
LIRHNNIDPYQSFQEGFCPIAKILFIHHLHPIVTQTGIAGLLLHEKGCPNTMTKFSKKVCLLGDFAVGKTSLVRRFVYDLFEDKYLSTIGVKVSRKSMFVQVDSGPVELTLMLWDLAGSEEFDHVRASYLRGAAGAVLVCDLTRQETLPNLNRYVNGLLHSKSDTKIILAANKLDLTEQAQLTQAQVEQAAQMLDVPVFFTSAKTGDEVESLFYRLGQMLID